MYATGGLKKFFRLMAMLLVIASVVGLLPLSAIAEGLKGENEPAGKSNAGTVAPNNDEETRAGEVTYQLVTDGNIVSGDTYLIVYGDANTGAANCTASSMRAMSSTAYSSGSTLTGTAPTFAASSTGNDTIASVGTDTTLYEWKFDLVDSANGYYTIQNNSTSTYLAISSTSDSNLTLTSTASSDYAKWSLNWSSPRFLICNKSLYNGSSYIHLNWSGTAFRNYYYGSTPTQYNSANYSQYLYHKVTAAPATTYTVSFNVNGDPNALTAQTGLSDGDSVTLPTPTVDFTDYEQQYFIGWVTQPVPTATAIGSINPVYYVNSASSGYYTTPFVVDATMANEDDEIVLYALFGNWDGNAETTLNSETVVTYELATAIEAGETYIIVNNASISGTTGYAVGNYVVTGYSHYLTGVEVTINSNDTCSVASANAAQVEWVAANATNSSNNTTGYSFYNTAVGMYMDLDSGEYIYPGPNAVAWAYTSAQRLDNQIDSGSYFFLSYSANIGTSSSGLKGYTTSKDSTTTDLSVRLYKRVETTTQIKVPAYTDCTTVLTLAGNKHDVTINFSYSDGTTAPAPVVLNVREGQTYTYEVEVPTGYTSNYTTITGTMGQTDVTYNVVFTPIAYHIYYKIYSDGTLVDSHDDTVNYNAAVTVWQPTVPAGYTLESYTWHIGSENGETTSEPATMPNSDLYAVASYSVNNHTVTYYSPDANTVYDTKTVAYGTAFPPASAPADPTREGYHFTGWTYTVNGSEFTGSTMPDADVVAVANWVVAATQVTLNIDPSSIDLDGTATATATITIASGAVLGTDYTINWSLGSNEGVVEFAGTTANQTTVTLHGLTEGIETITVTVVNANDNTSVSANAGISVGGNYFTATFYTVQSNTLSNNMFTYDMLWQERVEQGSKPVNPNGYSVADVTVDGVTYTFVGWIVSTNGSSYDTAHVYSFADLPALTGNTNYRAVYYNTDQEATKRVYVLVDEPVDGQDYIIVDTGASMAVTDDNVTDQRYLAPVPVTLDYSEGGVQDYYCYVSNDIAEDTVLWTFVKDGDNWKIQSKDENKYMTVTSDSEGYLTALTSDTQGARWSYDKTNNRLTLVTPAQNHKYLTFVGDASRGRFAKYIGFNDAELIMNAVQAAQNENAANNEQASKLMLTREDSQRSSEKESTRASYSYSITYHVGDITYTDSGTAESFTFPTLATAAPNFNFANYEQTNFIGWYPSTYALSNTAPTYNSLFEPGYEYSLSSAITADVYAMFCTDTSGNGTGITEIPSGYQKYVMETASGTLHSSATRWIFIMDAYQNRSLYASAAAGYVYSDTAYTRSDIVTDVFGNKNLQVSDNDYNHMWRHYYNSTNSNHQLDVQSTATGVGSTPWHVYYTGSSNPYSLYMSSSSYEPVEFTYGGTDSYGTYYSMVIDSSWYVYYNTSYSRYYEGSGTTYSSQSRYYVFAWDTYPYVITSANGYTTTPTAVAPTNYTITVNQPAQGGTISASAATAAAGTTINLTATPATGYTFGSWTVTNTSTGAAVTVTNNSFTMPAGNVTVTATFTQGGVQPGTVYYEPTSTIVTGEEYLIGYKDGNGNVYLMMNYNPNPLGSSNRYVSISANYHAYGIRAQMDGVNVVGVYNDVYADATINNAEWIFEQNGTGYYKIQSAYAADNGAYYLRIYQSTNYTDLYAASTDIDYYGHHWQWDPANNRLSFYYDYNGTTFTKYVTYQATAGSYSNLFNAPTTAASIQLYRRVTGSAADRRFTLSDANTATIKLYGIDVQTNNPYVGVTPNSQTLYWYDENVVWYDETAEIVNTAVLVGEYHNIAAGDIQSITWTSSDPSVVSIAPSADNSQCTVTAAAIGNAIVSYSITDIFGNVYTAEAQIVVLQAPMGEIPEEDETWYTGGPEYKVYIETDHFEAGGKYIIARDYTNNNNQVSISMPYFTRTNSMSTSGTYAIVYGNSTTLANCTVLKALSADTTSESSGSYEYRYKKAEDVQYNSDRTIIMPSGSIGWTPTASDTSGYYYLVSDESNSDYPYLFSNTSNSSGVYHYLNTTSSGTVRGSWSVSSTGSSSVRFSFQNYNNSGYITYDTTNNRFTVSSTQNYFYVYEKNTSAATFTTPMTLDLTTGARNVSCYTLAIGTNSSTLMPMIKENMLIKSSNEAVVSVNEDGTLNALMEGTSCVTVAIFVNGTAYMREITVRVTDTGSVRYPATTALHALRDASLYTATTSVYYSNADSVTTYTGMHYVEGTPVILYPGDSSTNNVAFVAVDPVLEDHVTWQYSSTGLMNMAEGTYMTGLRYTSSSSSSTYYNTLRLGSTNVTTSTSGTPYVSRSVTYGSNGYGSIGTGANLTIGNINVFYYMRDVETMLATGSYTGSIQSGVTYRIFKLSNITYNPGVYDDAQAGVDLFAIRDEDADRQYISQTSAVYNEVDAGENFHLTYELVDMPADYEQNAEDCEWELREQSMIEVNGQYVPVVTGFDEETGEFIINPALDGIEWSGYIVVGYVYSFTYPGDENVHEAANYGKIYFSSGTYQMTQDDLPEFPEPGFVGLDKTATTPYGAFINTGIGKVELTNFGIPASKPVDVVLILDLSGSMDYNITGTSERKIRKAKDAAIEFANTLLEGSDNSLSIVTFSDGAKVLTGDMTPTQASFIREGSLNSAAYLINQVSAYGGTDFDSALQYAYRIMYSNYQAYGDAHSRAVVFMTDGAPGYYNNVTLDSKLNGTQTGNWNSSSSYTDEQRMQAWDYWCRGNNSSYSMSSMFTTAERYNWSSAGTNMYLDAIKMTAGTVLTSSNFTNQTWVNALNGLGGVGQAKGLGATVYTVGFDIANSDYITAQSDIGLTGTSAAAVMRSNASSASYYYDADANTDLTDVFVNIAQAIRLVAENAVTTDTISQYFDLNVNTGYSYQDSSNQTVNGTATGSNQIVYGYYELDDNYNVKLDSSNNPIFHVVETVTITGTNNEGNNYEAAVTSATSSLLSGNIYNSSTGKIVAKWFTYDMNTKSFEWHINEGDKMEDKKMYSLSFSVRLLDEYRIDGTAIYPTNAHAELNYDDVTGYPVELPYPMPELPWSGGQVHYEFYLVNEEGQPIDMAGNVVPFSQRVIVYTGAVDKFHPDPEHASTIGYRASQLITDLGLTYTLYDEQAAYSVTIDNDSYNTGSATLVSNGATYVTGLPDHNTPYNVSGTYNYTNGAPVSTYVSFPVVFKLTINPDIIVVDYAVGVNVDVTENDLLPGTTGAAPLYAVGMTLPTSGTMQNAYNVTATANLAAGFVSKANGALTVTNAAGKVLGTAAVVTEGSKNVVKFTPTQYMISNPQVVDLYCAVQGRIPAADGATVTQRQAFMYEKLSIVPANVMYYDDTYFNTTLNPETNGTGAYVNSTYTMGSGYGSWQAIGSMDETVLQHTSRANDFGKPDVHGYDDTIGSYGGHSFNTAHRVAVKQYDASAFGTGAWPYMAFNFMGTGFEVVMDSMTNAGNVVVMVYNAAGTRVISKIIDSYYGTGELSQTPVVRIDLETYGSYKVVISAVHNAYYAMLHEKDGDKTDTTITIDAIRVFEPIDTGVNTAVGDIYRDNNQANPEVTNIQDVVIDSINLTAYNDIVLYNTDGTVAEAVAEEGGTYIIYSALAGGVLTNNNGTLGVTTVATGSISGVGSNAKWIFAPSEVENEYLDDGDDFVRYTVSNNGYYLTVNTASGAVEYGELGTTTTNASTVDFMNQWTYDGTRLITGPKQVIQGQTGNVTHFRNVYYALSYYTSFKAMASVAPSEADEPTTFNKLVHIDGGSTIDPEVYKTIGPNNEVYILPDSALTFRLHSAVEPSGVYVELKSTQGNTVMATMYSSSAQSATTTTETLNTAMGMYFSVTDKLTWTHGNANNGEDPNLWYSSPLVIYNATASSSVVTRPEDYILSVCNIKLTYAGSNAGRSANPFAAIGARQYEQIVNGLEALEWRTYSPLFDLNVHSGIASTTSSNGSHISRFSEAYITVTTSTDVGGLIVTDAAGRYVTVKSCTFVDNGSERVWTLTIDRTSTQRYNINVNTVSAVYDMRNPVGSRITVPAITSIVRPGDPISRPVA